MEKSLHLINSLYLIVLATQGICEIEVRGATIGIYHFYRVAQISGTF